MAVSVGSTGSSKEKEFGLIAFAAGVVTGARSFKVDKLGRLTGIHYPQIWKPGENIAECRKSSNDFYPVGASYQVRQYSQRDIVGQDNATGDYITYDNQRISHSLAQQMFMSSSGTISIPVPNGSVSVAPVGTPTDSKLKLKKDHPLTTCEHGFYAYYDGSDDYHGDGLVSGVVEGYGEAVIGTRGFRCMKAKIVALTVSPDLAKPVASLVHRNYKDVPQFVNFAAMVKAFPTDSAGMEPAPETDEDFWTRPI
jgi:hypothetical protein